MLDIKCQDSFYSVQNIRENTKKNIIKYPKNNIEIYNKVSKNFPKKNKISLESKVLEKSKKEKDENIFQCKKQSIQKKKKLKLKRQAEYDIASEISKISEINLIKKNIVIKPRSEQPVEVLNKNEITLYDYIIPLLEKEIASYKSTSKNNKVKTNYYINKLENENYLKSNTSNVISPVTFYPEPFDQEDYELYF